MSILNDLYSFGVQLQKVGNKTNACLSHFLQKIFQDQRCLGWDKFLDRDEFHKLESKHEYL